MNTKRDVTDEAGKLFNNHARSIPIDPTAIAEELGISVYSVNVSSEFSCAAGFDRSSNRFIVFNTNHNKRRKRFAIARGLADHTLGHVYKGSASVNYGFSHLGDLERSANTFAAHLLVPKVLLEIAMAEDINRQPNELCDIFDVSEAIISFRLQEFYKNYLKKGYVC